MKQYVIDGLRPEDHNRLKDYLDEHLRAAGIVGIYWLPLEKALLTPLQADHRDCAPHVFALKLEQTVLSCELLVRTKKYIRCECMAYATEDQRNWLIDQTDAILEMLAIRI
ncbi:MAG: hypothetical protein K9K21_06440 [Desulfotignum sp.]|nr:hypothetical protein [Desulfotignum sp.]MCF8113476.1 hypothetical protein [Desulfotignum sp.]MCF8125435.1 hypothetical protein [Desulfotignum sp.]